MNRVPDYLQEGFSDSVQASRDNFHAILNAMSRPGRIYETGDLPDPPDALCPASGAVCLTLLDFGTACWVDTDPGEKVKNWLRFHCDVPFTRNAGDADFGIITNGKEMPSLSRLFIGRDDRPDLSATLIVQADRLREGCGKKLKGPGVFNIRKLDVGGVSSSFWQERRNLFTLYPLGVDIIFTAGNRVAALPRSVSVEDC